MTDEKLDVIREKFVDMTVSESQTAVPDEAGYGPPDQGGQQAAVGAAAAPAGDAGAAGATAAADDAAGAPGATAAAETDEQKTAREAAEDAARDATPPEYKKVITQEKNRRRTVEAALEATRQQLADALALAARFVPNPNTAKPEPKREAFQDPESYIEARAEWKAEQIVAGRMADQARKAQENEGQRLQREHADRIAAAESKYPGIGDTARDPTLPVSDAMAAAIVTSEAGPDVLHYLDEHRDEAKRISGLPPARAAAEIGKIEANLTKPKETRVSSAPKPINALGGGGGNVVKGKYDPGLTDAEYFAIVEQEQAQRLAQLRGNSSRH